MLRTADFERHKVCATPLNQTGIIAGLGEKRCQEHVKKFQATD